MRLEKLGLDGEACAESSIVDAIANRAKHDIVSVRYLVDTQLI